MPTQGTNGRQSPHGLGAAVKEVAERASAIVHLELELAAMELRRKVASIGLGIGLLLGAALFVVFMLALRLRHDCRGARHCRCPPGRPCS